MSCRDPDVPPSATCYKLSNHACAHVPKSPGISTMSHDYCKALLSAQTHCHQDVEVRHSHQCPQKLARSALLFLAAGWQHRSQRGLQDIQHHPPLFFCRWQVGRHKPHVTPSRVAEVKADHNPIRAVRVKTDTAGETFMHNDRGAPSSFPVTFQLFVNVIRGSHQARFLDAHHILVINLQTTAAFFD